MPRNCLGIWFWRVKSMCTSPVRAPPSSHRVILALTEARRHIFFFSASGDFLTSSKFVCKGICSYLRTIWQAIWLTPLCLIKPGLDIFHVVFQFPFFKGSSVNCYLSCLQLNFILIFRKWKLCNLMCSAFAFTGRKLKAWLVPMCAHQFDVAASLSSLLASLSCGLQELTANYLVLYFNLESFLK